MGAKLATIKLRTQVELLAPELECCQLGHTCLIARGVNPTFHCQSARTHHLLHQSGSFLNKWRSFDISIPLQQKWSETTQQLVRTQFWPTFFRENQHKGRQKGGKPTFTRSAFQNPGWFGIIKEVLLSFKTQDEKRSCLGRGGLKCGNSVPKFELDFCPDHWGGPFGPKLNEPSSYIIQPWFLSKKSHSRTFAPWTSSAGLLKCSCVWGQELTRALGI